MWSNNGNRNSVRRNGSGSSNSFRSPVVPKSVGDAILQIDDLLMKWGVDADHSKAHKQFARCVKDTTADCFLGNILTEWDPIDTSICMPTNFNEALPLLLEHNLKQVTKDGLKSAVNETKDALLEKHGVHIPFPPYYQVGVETRLSRAYKELHLPAEELDPLRRFTYEERDVKDFLLDQFSSEPGEEFPPHFVRSLCLYEAVCGYPACLSCSARGSICWNSSLRTDFCHLFCEECDSVYTLRSVANSEKVQKLMDKGSHFGGSYAYFHEVCRHQQNSRSRNAKMFILFALRSNADGDSHKLPVYAAEIRGALPNLNFDSFNPERIRIKSNVIFRSRSRLPWFTVTVPRDVDISRLSMEVLNNYFDRFQET
jgi:hypothetical protein